MVRGERTFSVCERLNDESERVELFDLANGFSISRLLEFDDSEESKSSE